MYEIEMLEIHASHACNLTCDSCAHFSNSGHRGITSTEEADKWMGLWSKRINPSIFAILGGEPLLNPDIENFIRIARKHWKREVHLVTNGLLLHKFPTLPKTLEQENIFLRVTKHHDSPEYEEKWKEVLPLLKNINHVVNDSSKRWSYRYKGWGPNVFPYEDNNPDKSWDNCYCKFCRQLLGGKIYKCSTIAYLQIQKQRWPEISDKWDRYLAYKPLEATATDEEVVKFFSKKSEDICNMCPASAEFFKKENPLITIGELKKNATVIQKMPNM